MESLTAMKRWVDKTDEDEFLDSHRDRLLGFEVLRAFAFAGVKKQAMAPAIIADKALIKRQATNKILRKIAPKLRHGTE